METVTQTPTPKAMLWTGYVLSGLIVVMLIFSGVMKIAGAVDTEFTRLGWPVHLVMVIGIVEIACALIYAIPKTSVLGAILLTGYLGGAIATHVRIEEQFLGPAIGGVLVWLALFLRNAKLRELIPLHR